MSGVGRGMFFVAVSVKIQFVGLNVLVTWNHGGFLS